MSGTHTDQDTWRAATRYPDPAVISLDPRFDKYMLPLAAIERLATGCRWSEGPVWFGDARYLLWNDIPNNKIMRWDEATEQVSTYREPSNFANGQTRDRVGRLITCEHGGRRVTRTEYNGTITVLADCYDGKRLSSPNDVVVKSDGSIWFTDPPFGIMGNYEGYRAEPELGQNIYRLEPETGSLIIVADDVLGPNGLAFSPDETRLYVVESRGDPTRKILEYEVSPDGVTILNKRVLIDAGKGTPDGFRIDLDGNLWCGWGMGSAELDGVMIFAPDGTPIGRIALPERCANLCFGGRANSRLFMAASTSVYALYVNVAGVEGG